MGLIKSMKKMVHAMFFALIIDDCILCTTAAKTELPLSPPKSLIVGLRAGDARPSSMYQYVPVATPKTSCNLKVHEVNSIIFKEWKKCTFF